MALKEETTKQLPLTDFGRELYALLALKGIRTLAGLSKLLEQTDKSFSRQQLAAYANGTRGVPTSLPRRLVEALELNEEEQNRLAKAVAYGQPDERVKYEREI
jgi:HEAT repeat protein